MSNMRSEALEKSLESIELKQLLSRSHMYRLLSIAYRYPSSERQEALRDGSFVFELETTSQTLPYWQEIRDEVGILVSSLSNEIQNTPPADLEAEYNTLFAHSLELACPPYETSYGIENAFTMTRELSDIAGFYQAFGLSASREWHDRVDHVSAELEFMHFLTFKEAHARASGQEAQSEIVRDAEVKFMKDHLLRWLASFAEILTKASRIPLYASLGELTKKFTILEGSHLGLTNVRLGLKPLETKPVDDSSCAVDDPASGPLS